VDICEEVLRRYCRVWYQLGDPTETVGDDTAQLLGGSGPPVSALVAVVWPRLARFTESTRSRGVDESDRRTSG
jgi:hypothetical protein